MIEATCPDRIFSLENLLPGDTSEKIPRPVKGLTERIFGLQRLQRLYENVCAQSPDAHTFFSHILRHLNVSYTVSDLDCSRFPQEGPVIVVANHPFGMIEGIILADILLSVRRDVKVMANYLLGSIPELREHCILVDPFEGNRSASANVVPLRRAISWLSSGGLLIMFPAGEVSTFKLEERKARDRRWTSTLARLVRETGATVVPTHIDGSNGMLFHGLGMLHPMVRTALLPRMFLNKQASTVRISVGRPVPAKRLSEFDNDRDCVEYLRTRTYMLAHRVESVTRRDTFPIRRRARRMKPIAAPVRPEILERDIAALTDRHRLVENGDMEVYMARAARIPNVLLEIGRLRETTFREVGEGTGEPRDLDRFDDQYLHLFVWDRAQRAVVGAYRLAKADEVLGWYGPRYLYTSTLFRFHPALLRQLENGLEIGRAFVRSEYQKSYTPLLLLWKGIGAYVVRNPYYQYLFGPISISNDYRATSRHLMARFLELHNSVPDLSRLVRARSPFKTKDSTQLLGDGGELVTCDLEEIAWSIADIESDKGVPVLLRQYLKLGAKVLAFHVDSNFQNTVDGLMLVDLTDTDPHILARYMGRQGMESYLGFHRETAPAPHPRTQSIRPAMGPVEHEA